MVEATDVIGLLEALVETSVEKVGGAVGPGPSEIDEGEAEGAVLETPTTVVVRPAAAVDALVGEVLDDATLVSTHSTSGVGPSTAVSGPVEVVVMPVAPARLAESNTRVVPASPTTTSEYTPRPDRPWSPRMTPPPRIESAPTTRTVPTEPPENGRSQG